MRLPDPGDYADEEAYEQAVSHKYNTTVGAEAKELARCQVSRALFHMFKEKYRTSKENSTLKEQMYRLQIRFDAEKITSEERARVLQKTQEENAKLVAENEIRDERRLETVNDEEKSNEATVDLVQQAQSENTAGETLIVQQQTMYVEVPVDDSLNDKSTSEYEENTPTGHAGLEAKSPDTLTHESRMIKLHSHAAEGIAHHDQHLRTMLSNIGAGSTERCAALPGSDRERVAQLVERVEELNNLKMSYEMMMQQMQETAERSYSNPNDNTAGLHTRIPSFTGNRRSKKGEFQSWLNIFEMLTRHLAHDPETRITFLIPAMEGDALITVSNLDEEMRSNYTSLTNAMLQRYPPLYSASQNHMFFRTAKQRNSQSASEWVNYLRQLMDKAGTEIHPIAPTVENREKYLQTRMLDGLRSTLRETLEIRHSTDDLSAMSVGKIVELCQDIETSIQAAIRSHRRDDVPNAYRAMTISSMHRKPPYRHPNFQAEKRRTGRTSESRRRHNHERMARFIQAKHARGHEGFANTLHTAPFSLGMHLAKTDHPNKDRPPSVEKSAENYGHKIPHSSNVQSAESDVDQNHRDRSQLPCNDVHQTGTRLSCHLPRTTAIKRNSSRPNISNGEVRTAKHSRSLPEVHTTEHDAEGWFTMANDHEVPSSATIQSGDQPRTQDDIDEDTIVMNVCIRKKQL